MPFINDSRRGKSKQSVPHGPSKRAKSGGGYEQAAAQLRPQADPRRSDVYDREAGDYTSDYQGFDLTSQEGQSNFIRSLNVSMGQEITLKGILQSVAADAKQAVAQVMEAFGMAERGEVRLDAVTLCGDELPELMWNSDNPEVEYDILRRVAQTFPVASRQVEQIVLSAKYQGRDDLLRLYFDIFPAALSIYAHTNAYGRAALPRMQLWDRETTLAGESLS